MNFPVLTTPTRGPIEVLSRLVMSLPAHFCSCSNALFRGLLFSSARLTPTQELRNEWRLFRSEALHRRGFILGAQKSKCRFASFWSQIPNHELKSALSVPRQWRLCLLKYKVFTDLWARSVISYLDMEARFLDVLHSNTPRTIGVHRRYPPHIS